MSLWNFLIGAAAGVLSGCGIGGGSLLILYLTAVVGVEQYTAAGINLLYFLCCAPAALFSHIRNRLVERRGALICIAAGVATAILSALAASYVPTQLLRRIFGVLLLYIGARELFCKKKKTGET